MCNKKIIWVVVLVMASLSSWASANIKGNGSVVTREIKVSDYSSIRLGGNVSTSLGESIKKLFSGEKNSGSTPVFIYSQTDAPAALKVTLDENLIEYLEIKVENRQLIVQTKKNIQVNPTRFELRGHSPSLQEVKVGGSYDFRIEGRLDSDKLLLSVSGSGSVRASENIKTSVFSAKVSGSGNLYLKNISTNQLETKISGSGNANLGGIANVGDFAVSGSGNINAFECRVSDLSCAVSGSGDMKVLASNKLKASVSGSGDIQYKGAPDVDFHTSGSGSIRKAN